MKLLSSFIATVTGVTAVIVVTSIPANVYSIPEQRIASAVVILAVGVILSSLASN